MSETKRQTQQGRIKLDGKVFRDVDFQNAELIYEGGAMPNFIECTFTETRFAFIGPASNTVNFIRAMLPSSTNMRGVVLSMLPEFEQG